IIAFTYLVTGRHTAMMHNIKQRGVGAIMEEPVWLCKLVGAKIASIKQSIQDFIDRGGVGRKN
ncbi:MAG: hypothetical protein ABIH47_04400, partial [Candidatus Omnitrophota bacterium]